MHRNNKFNVIGGTRARETRFSKRFLRFDAAAGQQSNRLLLCSYAGAYTPVHRELMTIRGKQLCSNANDVTIDAITMVWPWESHEYSKDLENRGIVSIGEIPKFRKLETSLALGVDPAIVIAPDTVINPLSSKVQCWSLEGLSAVNLRCLARLTSEFRRGKLRFATKNVMEKKVPIKRQEDVRTDDSDVKCKHGERLPRDEGSTDRAPGSLRYLSEVSNLLGDIGGRKLAKVRKCNPRLKILLGVERRGNAYRISGRKFPRDKEVTYKLRKAYFPLTPLVFEEIVNRNVVSHSEPTITIWKSSMRGEQIGLEIGRTTVRKRNASKSRHRDAKNNDDGSSVA
ncbi:hypothetical protein WN48_04787 [Eufriesea mexicana]|uniref:Uncharacterized protein n=1 Tax=Eufriesea mexicana TaxID=516756 RepID=A0A310SKM0_9HYME|nr:hypothetical protein WN48_04787 [Eufriesea mexicana]